MKEVKSDLLPSDDDPAAYGLFEQACSFEEVDFTPRAEKLSKQVDEWRKTK